MEKKRVLTKRKIDETLSEPVISRKKEAAERRRKLLKQKRATK